MSPGKKKGNAKAVMIGDSKSKSSVSQHSPLSSSPSAASAYNPASGTFHILSSSDAGAGYVNGRFKSILEFDKNSAGNTEIECMSNSGSCSGESEDQVLTRDKDAKSAIQSALVGSAEKREKIRAKNERKHQRQRERRAQELREKCTSYLMSRKLDILSQQLVAMGFSPEQSTMALIANDGNVEQAVTWLLEGGNGQVAADWNLSANPKIDVSKELARIAEIEHKYKFSRPDIERAVISCEGDLDKALKFLQAHSQSLATGPSQNSAACLSDMSSPMKDQPILSMSNIIAASALKVNELSKPNLQAKLDTSNMTPSATKSSMLPNGVGKLHPAQESPGKGYTSHDRKLQQFPSLGVSPATSQGLHYRPSPLIAQAKTPQSSTPVMAYRPIVASTVTSSYLDLNPPKLLQSQVRNQSPRDPISTVHLRPLSYIGPQPIDRTIHSPLPSAGAIPVIQTSTIENVIPGIQRLSVSSTPLSLDPVHTDWRSLPNNDISKGPSWDTLPVQPISPPVTSHGLFTGWHSKFQSGSSVDWSSGPSAKCDYRNIDWSMTVSPSSASTTMAMNGLTSVSIKPNQKHRAPGLKFEDDAHSSMLSGDLDLLGESNKTGLDACKTGPQTENGDSNTNDLFVQEWTTPFGGKDLFKLPQTVPSPFL